MNNEYHAQEDSNLEESQGQTTEGVGQDDGSSDNKTSSTDVDWEKTAKYQQSEKDKLYDQNQRLTKLDKVGEYIRTNPDLAKKLAEHIDGDGGETKVELSKEEFDPWEAYNDPASKSYKFREQEEHTKINSKVGEAVDSALTGVRKDVAMEKLVTQLEKRGMSDEQVKSFVEFTSQNPANYGIDGAIKMWQAVSGQPTKGSQNENPLDAIRQNQAVPQQAGVLNGQEPVRKDEKDTMWEGIMKAGSRTRVL